MSDIVERLNARVRYWDRLLDATINYRDSAKGTEHFAALNSIAHTMRGRDAVEGDAADTITRLRADNERLREALVGVLNLPYGSDGYCRAIARRAIEKERS